MIKRVMACILILFLAVIAVGGCSEFFGTIAGRLAANKHAIDYIHEKYNIPIERLDASIPSYRYGMRQYLTEIRDSKDGTVYSVLVRMWGEGDVMDIEEIR
ncbi:hypothetical protein [Brevibacillus borstelensis]|uniref:hypothetical protein n=1 Tax=Brevibacillus borstelensis TaxID=45462 RepID=UPI0030C58691